MARAYARSPRAGPGRRGVARPGADHRRRDLRVPVDDHRRGRVAADRRPVRRPGTGDGEQGVRPDPGRDRVRGHPGRAPRGRRLRALPRRFVNPNPVIKQAPHVPLNTTDRLALHELANRYGNAVDARDWDALAAVFAPDARFVIGADEPSPVVHVGIDAIIADDASGPSPRDAPHHQCRRRRLRRRRAPVLQGSRHRPTRPSRLGRLPRHRAALTRAVGGSSSTSSRSGAPTGVSRPNPGSWQFSILM